MYVNIKILLFIIIIIIIYEIYIRYNLTDILFLFNNISGLTANKCIKNKINKIIKEIKHKNKYTIYDLGFGKGDILEIFNQYNFKKIIGIELDKNTVKYAKKKLSKNILLYNQDMLKFNYRNNPSIFYLYEPLWTIDYNIAMNMYNILLKKLSKIDNIYIIYITGIKRNDINEKLLNKYNFYILEKDKIGSIFIKNNIYLIKKKYSYN